MQNLKKIWLVNSKLLWGILQILTQALKNLKNLNFNELLLTKVYNVWANKKVQRSYVWLHWRLMQIFTRARSKVQKLGLLLGQFLCFFTTFDLIWPPFCPKDHTQLTFFLFDFQRNIFGDSININNLCCNSLVLKKSW